ncbi:MAG: aminotransferase class IV [Candidatus Tectimicrobiota bacterium]
MWVYMNDTFVPAAEARVSVLDRGFLYGDGLFETLAAYDGRLFRLEAHLERLYTAAAALGFVVPVDQATLGQCLYACLAKNAMQDAILRVSVSRGQSQRGLSTLACSAPTLLILCFPPRFYPPTMLQHGVHVIVSSVPRALQWTARPQPKTTNFLNNILALREAEAAGAVEALMLNAAGHLTEGAVSNVFLVRDGALWTPALACGVLPGITRAAVLEVAAEQHLTVHETCLEAEALWSAQEAFYTNTTALIMPITQINAHRLGAPGPITQRLRQGLVALIEREAGRLWSAPGPQ